jgi:hypothetical protein
MDGPALIIRDLTVMMARSVHAQQWELRLGWAGKREATSQADY